MKGWILALCTSLLVMTTAWCAPSSGGSSSAATCHDSGFLSGGRAFSDLCWDCFFPIRIVGVPIGFGSRGPNKLPDDVASPICVCPGRFGITSVGITLGYWAPEHVTEIVRHPMCSPIFGGVQMPYGNGSFSTPYGQILGAIETGGPGTTPSVTTGMVSEQGAHAMYNVHTYKFPGAMLLNMVMDMVCAPKGNFDMDAVWFSEIDPTWQDEQLALYTAPETNLFANLYTHATCILDGVATTVRKPILGFWWCAGTWGPLYPQASRQQHSGEFDAQMLSAMKLIAHLHRFGMLTLKYGDLAVCKEIPWFVAPHEQYQFQNFWPMPVDDAKWPGTSFWLWGLGRTEPVSGEDRVMLEWDYHECCATLW